MIRAFFRLMFWRWLLSRHPLTYVMAVEVLIMIFSSSTNALLGWFAAFVQTCVIRWYRPSTYVSQTEEEEL